MEVILRDDVPKLGNAGELVKVKNGYARNYLIPRGLAYTATAANKKRWEAEARSRLKRLHLLKADAEKLAGELSAVEVNFAAKVGEGDKLFGSVTSQDIADRLAEKGFTVDRRHIELAEPIRTVGAHTVTIKLHPEVRAELRVWVVRE